MSGNDGKDLTILSTSPSIKELNTSGLAEHFIADVEELNKLLSQSTRQKCKDILTLEIRKVQTEISRLQEQIGSSGESIKPTSVVPQQSRCYEVKLNNYAWDQSDKFVKIFVTLKNVHTLPAENVYTVFTENSMELHMNKLDNRNYTLPLKNLLEKIDGSKSSWKVKTGTTRECSWRRPIEWTGLRDVATQLPLPPGTAGALWLINRCTVTTNTDTEHLKLINMVVVSLAKEETGKTWSHLTSSEKKAKEPKPTPKLSDNADPSAGLMDLMKQMYEDGDDDMKRSIAKAWTESRNNSGMPSF
ncbi:hypothetical protein J6590_020970 [Homalodisca vitripennis]|nr:hypothetical protein J6590_020970 [Homalodisca vitripennis]